MNTPTIGYLIKAINYKLRTKANADLKQHNLTLAQTRVLAFLNDHGGKSQQKDIEAFLGVSHATICGIISRMERAGHIITMSSHQDRRTKIVYLTESSRMTGTKLVHAIRDGEASFLRGLSEEQIRQLHDALVIIYNNLNTEA